MKNLLFKPQLYTYVELQLQIPTHLCSQVPHRVTSYFRSNKLLYDIQKSLICPQVLKSLVKMRLKT